MKTIRPATPDDYDAILRLNSAAIPHVNEIDRGELKTLHEQSIELPVVEVDGEVAGFVILLDETAGYASLNFQYFKRHYPHFAYVDRIVIGSTWRRRQLGHTFYAHLARGSAAGKPVIACEVNLKPPNPQSGAFHRAEGFDGVDEQDAEGGAKRVLLMVRHDANFAN